jgi:hypothetical protein
MRSMPSLTPEKSWIFRILHIDNIPSLLANGIHSRNSPGFNPDYRNIGNPDLIDRRSRRQVPFPPGGTLSDYVPFYFTPLSPMLLNIKTGHDGLQPYSMEEIVILVASLRNLVASGKTCLFTDRHAALATAQFSNDLQNLSWIDWNILQACDFKRDTDDPGKFERYQAEALIHETLSVTDLAGIVCYDEAGVAQVKKLVETSGLSVKIIAKRDCYF